MSKLSRRNMLISGGALVGLSACETTNIGQIAEVLGQTGA